MEGSSRIPDIPPASLNNEYHFSENGMNSEIRLHVTYNVVNENSLINKHSTMGYPEMASLETRLNSFPDDWNEISFVSKESIAEAGMFYLNDPDYPDKTACFHCSLEIIHWEDGEDPWNEHLRWVEELNISCVFLRLVDREEVNQEPEKFCVVCLEKRPRVVFLPCKHLVCCPLCSIKLGNCPICRNIIKQSFKVFC